MASSETSSGPVWGEEVDIKVYTPVCLPPPHSHHSYFGQKAWVYGNLSNTVSWSKGWTETKVNLTFINVYTRSYMTYLWHHMTLHIYDRVTL